MDWETFMAALNPFGTAQAGPLGATPPLGGYGINQPSDMPPPPAASVVPGSPVPPGYPPPPPPPQTPPDLTSPFAFPPTPTPTLTPTPRPTPTPGVGGMTPTPPVPFLNPGQQGQIPGPTGAPAESPPPAGSQNQAAQVAGEKPPTLQSALAEASRGVQAARPPAPQTIRTPPPVQVPHLANFVNTLLTLGISPRDFVASLGGRR